MSKALYVLFFVGLLAGAQGYAFFRQWDLGYRPFGQAPQRVALSWDMFAVRIERCGVEWSPPVHWQGRELRSLKELAVSFEWDAVYNRKEDYINAAAFACGMRAPGPSSTEHARFSVHCFAPGGEETRDEFLCPGAR